MESIAGETVYPPPSGAIYDVLAILIVGVIVFVAMWGLFRRMR